MENNEWWEAQPIPTPTPKKDKYIFGEYRYIYALILVICFVAWMNWPSQQDIEGILCNCDRDQLSPADFVQLQDIKINGDTFSFQLKGRQLSGAGVLPTRSMDPTLDSGTTVIAFDPENEAEIHEGDIISYNKWNEIENRTMYILHRVVFQGWDDGGWYVVTKGDNNEFHDNEKIRFDDVRKVVVALVY